MRLDKRIDASWFWCVLRLKRTWPGSCLPRQDITCFRVFVFKPIDSSIDARTHPVRI